MASKEARLPVTSVTRPSFSRKTGGRPIHKSSENLTP